ncbi:MAG: glycosyltransferase family 2 protein [Planctomycetota bacterium]
MKELFMLPKVTIVTPSYNQAGYLEKTILSVLNQDYPDIEYIIIDGGSTDGSVDIIKRYQDRLAYWISEPDKGQSDAINKGFKRATGRIFNWLNSDDLLMPSAVKIAVYYLMNNSDVGIVYGNRITIDERGNFLSLTRAPSYNARIFRHHLAIPQETTFFRSELWSQVDGVEEELKFCMDYDLFVKLSKITQFYHIPFVLGAYRKHPLSKTVMYSGTLKTARREEAGKVYRRHYLKDRSRLKAKFCKKLNNVRIYFETESKSSKREVGKILKIIHDSNDTAE